MFFFFQIKIDNTRELLLETIVQQAYVLLDVIWENYVYRAIVSQAITGEQQVWVFPSYINDSIKKITSNEEGNIMESKLSRVQGR